MIFWQNVETIVRQQKTSFRWIAEKLNVSETTVSGWRRTNVLPRADQAVIIAQSLGVTVEYLVTGHHEDRPLIMPWMAGLIDTLGSIPPEQLGDIPLFLEAKSKEAERVAKDLAVFRKEQRKMME